MRLSDEEIRVLKLVLNLTIPLIEGHMEDRDIYILNNLVKRMNENNPQ